MPRAVRRPAAPPQPARRGHSAAAPLDIDAFFAEVDATSRTEPRRALGMVERALQKHGHAPADPALRPRLIRMRGHVRRMLNDYTGALADYRVVHEHYRRAENRLELAITQIGRIDALMYRGRYRQALACAALAREIFSRLGERIRGARLESNVGNLYHRWDRPEEALRHYDRAGRVFSAAGDAHGRSLVDMNRGNVLSSLGRFEESDAAYRAAHATAVALGLDHFALQIEYNRAYLLFLQERLTAGLAAFDELLPRLARLGDHRHEALVLMDTAEILLRLNLPVEAEERARRAAAAFKTLEMRYEQARSLAFHGMALFRLRRLDRAGHAWRRSLALFGREENTLWRSALSLGLARLDFLSHRMASATRRALAAEQLLGSRGPADRRAECRLLRAIIAMEAGESRDMARAGILLKQALKLTGSTGTHWLRRDILEALGDCERRQGHVPEARARYEAAVAAGEALRDLISGDDFRAAFFRDRSRPYLHLALQEIEAGHLQQAWEWVDRSRARALVEELDDLPREARPAGRAGAAELETLLRRLAAQYHRDIDRHAAGSRPATEVSRLPDSVRRHLESRAESLVGRIYPELRATSSLRRPRSTAAPASGGLAADESLVTYVELDGAISAFVQSAAGLSVVTDLADTDTIAAAADRLSYQWGRFRLGGALLKRHGRLLLEDTIEDLGLLHGLLIAPLRSAEESRRWIVSPSSALASLPFAAFHDGQRFLVERRSLAITPSLGVLTRCRERIGRSGHCALLLGQTGATTPEVGRELDDLAASLKGATLRRLEGAAATVAAYFREAGDAGYIHLASHGFFHTERPRLSGIRLADRWLHAHDVVRQPLTAELVVLSACQSGLSLALEGEEWLGLPRAFLKAGAARVLASLWDVDDRSTRALMAHFAAAWWGDKSSTDRARARGKGPAADALRTAQMALMARHRHPYFWAGFQLVGAP